MRRRGFCIAVALGPASGAAGARADALQAPTGAAVLTVSGRIRNPNVGGNAVFDMPMLERLPHHEIHTRTPWYPEARRFSGPRLRDVLERAGADGVTVRAIALNDYRVDIPMEDARRYDVIVARLLDGAPMPVREKGPLFVMYPFDAVPALRTAVHYSRCIWQLQAIEVL